MTNNRLIWKLKHQALDVEGWMSKCETPAQKTMMEGISPVIRKLLASRGIVEPDAVERFLNPGMEHMHDPLLLPDMALAVNRIRKACQEGERIWVYGDYDVDGITSISILMKYFEARGIPARYYIPDRMDEGYGLNEEAIRSISSEGCEVLITVDCGITATKEALVAKSCGIDLIITDHHECPEILPQAFALINPKRKESVYPYDMLAGAGVAYKLTRALSEDMDESLHRDLLALAAIGTIADIAPLTDENRVLAKYGLEIINESAFTGLKQLIEKCGLSSKKITAGHIGYFLAPKINASGRIGDPELGVKLLLGHESQATAEIAEFLVKLNEERQLKEREVLAYCFEQIETEKLDRNKILIVHGNDFHSGIIGIVASRIVERYHRPVVVLSLDRESGIAKGSARSVEGVSIYEALCSGQHLYEKFGGHDMAAGLSFKLENLEAFKEQMATYGFEHIADEDLLPILRLEDELGPKDIDYRLMDQLEHLEPFGAANPKPVFSLKGLSVEAFRRMGKGEEHVKISVSDGDRIYDAVAFNVGDAYGHILQSERLDLAFTLEKNSFKGIESIQMMIRDMRRDAVLTHETLRFEFKRAESWFKNAVNHSDSTASKADISKIEVLTLESLGALLEDKEKRVVLFCGTAEALHQIRNHFYDLYHREMDFALPDQRFPLKRIAVVAAPVYECLPEKEFDAVVLLDLALTQKEMEFVEDRWVSAESKIRKRCLYSFAAQHNKHDLSGKGSISRVVPERDVLVRIYKYLKTQEGTAPNLSEICRVQAISAFTAGLALALLSHLGMVDYALDGMTLRFALMPVAGKLDLNETASFRAMMAYKKMQV